MQAIELDLHTPSRQSGAAIVFILLRFLRRSLSYLWPLLLVLLFQQPQQGNGFFATYLLPILLVVAGLQLIASLITYFRFYFYVAGEELIIEKGLFNRTKLNLPFDRIQSINFEQNVLHQIFQVVSLKIDTAGSAKEELSLHALERSKAEALRAFIMEAKATEQAVAQAEAADPEATSKTLLFRRTEGDLLKVGMTQNHLQMMGVIVGAIFGLWNYLDDFMDIDYEQLVPQLLGFQIESYGWLLLGMVPVLLVVAFVISLVRTFLRYYDLHLYQTERGFNLIAGLLNRQEKAAPHHKIQLFRWSTDPLRQVFGLFTVRISQASSARVRRKQAIQVPGCSEEDVQTLLAAQFSADVLAGHNAHGISPLFISRRLLWLGMVPSVLLVAGSFRWAGLNSLWLLLLIPLVYFLARRYQRRYQWSLNADALLITAGFWATRRSLLELYKVQAVKLTQTPYMRRHAVATISLHTAAGAVNIPYAPLELAQALQNYVLYRVESDGRAWM